MADRIIKRDELPSLRQEISVFLQFRVPDRVPDMRVIARAREEGLWQRIGWREIRQSRTDRAYS